MGKTTFQINQWLLRRYYRLKAFLSLKNHTIIYGEGYTTGYSQALVDLGARNQYEHLEILRRLKRK